MQELEMTWGRVLSVWWLTAWRGAVGLMAIASGIGAVFGAVIAAANIDVPLDVIEKWGTVLSIIVYITWWIIVTRMALTKRYRGFRIALVPVTPD